MSVSYIPRAMQRLVRERALDLCEYCLFPEKYAYFRHHIDHIIAEKHGGATHPDNLALACRTCNLRKGSNITTLVDPNSQRPVRLFHPRFDQWKDHFLMVEYSIQAKTEIGYGTILLLELNHVDRLLERQLLIDL
ncbi:MAG: HNH endonuclease signature motif containing protein [Bacteroidota bacterium]